MLAATDIPNLDAAKINTGILPVARGGTNTGSLTGNRIMVSTPTAIVEAAALTNGQILIGSTGAAPVPATLTAGTGVTINNSAGGISISATGTGGTVTNVTGTAPISVATGTTTPVVSISQANTTTNGYLSSTDWNIFNNKQASLSAGATINGIVYPATALQTMQIPLAPVNLTDAVNKQYVDTQVASGANQWTLSGGNVYRASGNVGIGTTTPVGKLHVMGTTRIDSANIPLVFNESDQAAAPGKFWRMVLDSKILRFDIDTVGDGSFASYAAPFSMYPDGNSYFTGNVGIGTSTPAHKLHVDNGNIELSVNYGIGSVMGSATGERSLYPSYSGFNTMAGLGPTAPYNVGILLKSDEMISFSETDTNAIIGYMDVNAKNFIWDGKVGIGTIAPSEKLEVVGNVKATAYLYTSDRRLKDNIETIADSSNKVMKLRGVEFDWKKTGEHELGFIAQEVEAVEPNLVVTSEVDGMKAVKYGNVVALLVEAFKEDHKKIDENKKLFQMMNQGLDLRVKKMEREIASLKEENQKLRDDIELIKKHLKMK